MDFARITDSFQTFLDKAQDNKSGSTLAVVGTGAVLLAGAYFISRPNSKKTKPGVFELTSGDIANANVKKEFTDYGDAYGTSPGAGLIDKQAAPEQTDVFYNLVTDFYEWGWGQSFHFSPPLPGKGWYASEVAHETRVATLCGLKPGMNCLDAGCGVGGPMRTIACAGGANVTGLTINAYQVKRANYHNDRLGIDLCNVVEGNFLSMPFEDNHFDAAYAIEATCHSPTLEAVYKEILRVMKPGAIFVTYEWVSTPKFDPSSTDQVKIMDEIIYGNGLPDMRTVQQALDAAKAVGFEVVECRDLALNVGAGHWYDRMEKVASKANVFNKFLVNLLSTLRLLPKGVKQVHDMLLDSAACALVAGGKKEIFTPMHLLVLKKPTN